MLIAIRDLSWLLSECGPTYAFDAAFSIATLNKLCVTYSYPLLKLVNGLQNKFLRT